MKRDWDTIREILLEVEKLEPTQQLRLSDFDDERAYEVSYHVQLMAEFGLIDATISATIGPQAKQFFVSGMTWEGHEFLDAVREKSTWSKVKTVIREKGGVMTFEVIKATATGLIKAAIS